MPYPDRYDRTTDFARDQQLGIGIRGSAVNAELSRLASVTNQVNTFLRRFTTTDGKLKLDQAVRLNDVITEELFNGTGAQTVFVFAQPIDATVDLVRVFVGGVRTDPISYNDTTFTMAVAPIAGTDNVQALIYTNLAGVLDRMLSVVQDEGANLIGYDDPEGRYVANTVGPALTEVMRDLDDLIIALGDLSQYVLTNGTRELTGQWELNERSTVTIAPAVAVGSFRINALPLDGDLTTVADGSNPPIVFEWDDNSIVTPGNTPVTIGLTIAASAANFVTAMANAPVAVKATESNAGAYRLVALTNEIPYAAGNIPIVNTSPSISNVTGMVGGVDGSFSAAYKTYFRVRNSPRSIRDGDVVVHEQLADLQASIVAIITVFLRTDGSNQMVAPLDFGGYKAVALAAGTDPTDGVNKAQLDAAVAASTLDSLAPDGLKDSVARGTLTGPLTLGELAIDIADADQVTSPGTVIKHTITGVPRPSSLDQVTNKKYVDDAISAALTSINLSGVGIDGTGLGAPIAAIVGGIYEFVALTITVAQAALAGPVEIFSEGDITINAGALMLVSDYTIKLRAGGNITILGDINCRGLDVRCVGNLTLGGTISANRGFPTLADQQRDWDSVCAFRFKCGGNLNDGGSVLDARDIFGYVAGDAIINGAWTSLWTAKITGVNLDGLDWPYFPFGPTAPRTAGAGGGQHGASDAVGGSGGTGGGHGGSFNGGGFGASDPYRGTARLSLLDIKLLRGGSSGGCGTSGASGYAGGRISLYVAGDAVCTGAVLSSVGGATGGGGGNDPGGGGAGVVRAVVGKTLTDGSFTADGGNGAFSRGGGGGGGGSLLAADTFAGVQAQTVNSAGFIGGLTGTIETAVIPTVDIVALALTGIFDV